MITRQQMIAILVDFAGPLGPFESLDERLDRRDQWVTTADNTVIDALLNVLVYPPDESEIYPVTREGFELHLSELLVLLGRHDSSYTLEKIGPYLSNELARPTVIEVIGGLGSQQGISWIKPLLNEENLTEDELVRLACALGEIGGAEAHRLLKQMRASSSTEMKDLHREINIALQSVE